MSDTMVTEATSAWRRVWSGISSMTGSARSWWTNMSWHVAGTADSLIIFLRKKYPVEIIPEIRAIVIIVLGHLHSRGVIHIVPRGVTDLFCVHGIGWAKIVGGFLHRTTADGKQGRKRQHNC